VKDRLLVSLMLVDLAICAGCLLLAWLDADAALTGSREGLVGVAVLALLNYAVLRAARRLP